MPDLTAVFEQLRQLNDKFDAIPNLVKDEIEKYGLISKTDIDHQLESYSPTVDINATVAQGFQTLTTKFDALSGQLTKRSLEQQVLIDHQAGELKNLTNGHNQQQERLARLDALLELIEGLVKTDIPAIRKEAEADRLEVSIWRGRILTAERDIIEVKGSIAETNLKMVNIQKENNEAKARQKELDTWHTNYENAQAEQRKLRLARKEKRNDLIANMVNKGIYVALRAGIGGGVVTALGGLFELAGR